MVDRQRLCRSLSGARPECLEIETIPDRTAHIDEVCAVGICGWSNLCAQSLHCVHALVLSMGGLYGGLSSLGAAQASRWVIRMLRAWGEEQQRRILHLLVQRFRQVRVCMWVGVGVGVGGRVWVC